MEDMECTEEEGAKNIDETSVKVISVNQENTPQTRNTKRKRENAEENTPATKINALRTADDTYYDMTGIPIYPENDIPSKGPLGKRGREDNGNKDAGLYGTKTLKPCQEHSTDMC